MLLNVLAVGDVVGAGGLSCLERHLRTLKRLHQIDFTVVNGENADGWESCLLRHRLSWTRGRM